jgi:uncharacterized protein
MADDAASACITKGNALVAALAAGDASRATVDFDATMRAALPPETLAAVWVSTVAKSGAYEGADAAVAARGNEAAPHLTVIPLRFAHAALNAVVACDAAGAVAGFHLVPRPAAQTPPAAASESGAFSTEALTVGAEGVQLGATLYRPRAASAAAPAVLLLAGSGPQDRDSTLGATKPLRDLAEGLAKQGVVVLTYDKRTLVHPDRPVSTVNDEVVDDAVAALRRLASLPGVDKKRVLVLGHSWGGTLAPRVATRARGVAGLVLLAAGVEPLEDAYRRQLRYLAERDGRVDDGERAELAKADAEARRLDDLRHGKTVEGRLPFGIPASYWQDLAGYDPVAVARSLGVPVLALWAGRDYQVPAESARDRWVQGFSGRTELTVHVYPTLGHTFMPMSDPPDPARLFQAGHVEPEVVLRVAQWINRVKPTSP